MSFVTEWEASLQCPKFDPLPMLMTRTLTSDPIGSLWRLFWSDVVMNSATGRPSFRGKADKEQPHSARTETKAFTSVMPTLLWTPNKSGSSNGMRFLKVNRKIWTQYGMYNFSLFLMKMTRKKSLKNTQETKGAARTCEKLRKCKSKFAFP